MSRFSAPVVTTTPGTIRGRALRTARPARRPTPTSTNTHRELPHPTDIGLGQLFLHTRDAVVVGNINSGRIVLWNPAAERLFGYSPEEAIGRPIDMLIPPPIARLHHEALALYRRTGEGTVIGSHSPIEVPAHTKSGEEVRIELSLVPLDATPDGRQYVMALMRDTSDRKRAELSALEAVREKTARADAESTLRQQAQLLRGGIEELSTPVARLQRSASRLASIAQAEQSRGISQMARVVEARAQALHRTMRHLVDATAIQSASLELRTERINLVPLINRVMAAARSRAPMHKINVGLPQGLTALVDPERLEQVVEALVEQAVRRNPRGCWIDVDLKRPLVGLARLEVRDYGRAVSAEEIQELLETNGATEGLAVSRWIIEQHGGTLSAETPAEGGLKLIVTLPTQHGRVPGA